MGKFVNSCWKYCRQASAIYFLLYQIIVDRGDPSINYAQMSLQTKKGVKLSRSMRYLLLSVLKYAPQYV